MASSTVALKVTSWESHLRGGPLALYVVRKFCHREDLSETFDRILTRKTTNDPVKFVQNLYRDTIEGSIYGSADDFKLLINNLFEFTHLKNL